MLHACIGVDAFASNGIGPLYWGSQKGRARAHNTRNPTGPTYTYRHQQAQTCFWRCEFVIHKRARCERMRLLFCDVIIYFSHVRIFYSVFFLFQLISLLVIWWWRRIGLLFCSAVCLSLHVEVYISKPQCTITSAIGNIPLIDFIEWFTLLTPAHSQNNNFRVWFPLINHNSKR